MNATRIIYTQYWETTNAEVTFARHLEVLKQIFVTPNQKAQMLLWLLVCCMVHYFINKLLFLP
jgi:hypothetical protein